MDLSPTRLALAGPEMVVQLFVEFLSCARRNFKTFSILYQLDHVARTIQDGPAMSAIFKVQSQASAQGSVLWFAKIPIMLIMRDSRLTAQVLNQMT